MEKKITQKEVYNAIIAKLNGEDTALTVEQMVEFVEGRIAQLDKKSANKKPSKTQAENEVLKDTIVNILTELGSPVTASIVLADERIPSGTSLPKITSMLTALVNDKVVVRTVDKRKAYFYVPTDEE